MSEIGIRSQSYSSMLQKQLLGVDSPSVSATKPESSRGSQSSQGAGSFADTLKQAMETTNDLQVQADEASKDFAAGKGNLHETMIAMEKADISLRTLTAVRGKLVEAYQEIMRMPV